MHPFGRVLDVAQGGVAVLLSDSGRRNWPLLLLLFFPWPGEKQCRTTFGGNSLGLHDDSTN